MVFGLTLIAAIAAQDLLKGLIAGFFGLMIGAIGVDPVFGTPRATFGLLELYDGVPLIPALIGLFAISEAFVMLESETIVRNEDLAQAPSRRAGPTRWTGCWMTARYWWQTVWTSLIGLIIGILPGAGSTVAAFLAYHYSKLLSKTPELYGTGHPPGVIAPESANNGVTSGTLVPVFALGIPGGTTGAIMMIVLTYHGVVLGPRLFIEQPELVYGVYMQMMVCYLFMVLMILPLARYMSRVVWIPTKFLVPLILSLVTIAAFSEREYVFDMGLALVLRRDRLHRAQDRLRGHRDPDRRADGAAVRAVLPARAAGRAGRPDDPVLVDARQRAVGDGGAGAGAAVHPLPPAAGRAGPDPARRATNRRRRGRRRRGALPPFRG